MSLSQTLDKSKVVQNVVLNNAVLAGASGVTTSAINVDNASSLAGVQLTTNAGSGQVQLTDPAGGRLVSQSYVNNNAITSYIAPAWNPLLNYNNLQGYIVVYGTNTAPAGSYPNNLFEAYLGVPGSSTVVGTPPTSTAAPYPALGPTPNSGWILCSTANFIGGAAVLAANGQIDVTQTVIGAGRPATTYFFGGGGESIGTDVPRGMTLSEADITTISGNNGALLDVAGVAKADGFYVHDTNQSLSPAASANGGVNFTLGQNYTWTAPVAPATAWTWVGSAGTGGSTTITGPAQSMAFDPNCMMMVTRLFVTAAAHAIGILCVDSKTATSMVISSRAPADQSLVALDVGRFEWICFNPNWTS
jgi:hypothetical protein